MNWSRIAALAGTAGLLVACGGSAGATGNPSGNPAVSAPASSAATVKLVDFSLSPSSVSVPAGASIQVVNAGQSTHNLWIRDASGKTLARTPELKPGATAMLSVPANAGSYTIYCQEPGHESLGMRGTLSVT